MWRSGYTGVRCFSNRPPFAMCRILYILGIPHPYAKRRKLPLVSVVSRGPPSPHILLEIRLLGIWDGVRGSKLLNQYLRKIQCFSDVLPDFSIRQLPSATVGFRGLPGPRKLSEFGKRGILEWGSPKPIDRYLPESRPHCCFPHFRFRQIQPDPVGFRGLP